ncbi:uncharacterized protein LOC114967744 [Acropora millepora]|uniref:uncharacterized protein LOC114967744 n=1 Tax=Acropora millepora TaxID=45264 RepID=UPI001CF244C4|nr:uncharacterized protein LOC114967744 [Acropora millepora]XP_044170183.1 uncharacterized protein LOC114967744 [Acropora millepora]XP_044170184.1 uncharacterized protein LOC114967744 [Acropora millepora]XP_044170185.1 uncharacterized protein LOC114967744 [Acropora millepora]
MLKGERYEIKDPNVVHFFFREIGSPSNFRKIINQHINGLLNTNGGVLVFGVEPKNARILGLQVSREGEDLLKRDLDSTLSSMCPTVSPNLCRVEVSQLQDAPRIVVVIKISPGPIGDLFINACQQVFIIRRRELFGPLFPQEIKELVIAKYREEISSSASLLSPVRQLSE